MKTVILLTRNGKLVRIVVTEVESQQMEINLEDHDGEVKADFFQNSYLLDQQSLQVTPDPDPDEAVAKIKALRKITTVERGENFQQIKAGTLRYVQYFD